MKYFTGKVLKATRTSYDVSLEEGIIQCTLRGRAIFDTSTYNAVKVGDNVKISLINPQEGVIEEILPRKSQLSRTIESRAYTEKTIAANIDQLLIVLSTQKPKFKSGLLDRYLIIAEKNKLRAIICINKMDLAQKSDFEAYRQYYTRLEYSLFFTSALTGEGLPELKTIFKDKVTAIVGYSGVGKSSIIKALNSDLDIKIGAISERTRKGQHTTTAAQLFPLQCGGFLIDTPGIRELGFWGIYKKDLSSYFIEFGRYAPDCQFTNCSHIHEPGCAVKAAVEQNDIFPERYENFLNIHASLKSAAYEK